MRGIFRLRLLLLSVAVSVTLLAAVLVSTSAAGGLAPDAAENCDPDVVQPNGAVYRFCLPPGWDGGALLVYAHGYVWFNEPLEIPDSHICLGSREAKPASTRW